MLFAIKTLIIVLLLTTSVTVWAQEKEAEKKEEEPINWLGIFVMHYHNRVGQFRQENPTLPPDRRNIVFVGDSITEGFALPGYFPGLPVLNRGIGADGIGFDNDRGILHRMNESIFDCSPSAVFLLIGVNDLPQDPKTPEACIAGYRQIVEEILAKKPDTAVILQTLLPVGLKYFWHEKVNPRISEFNDLIRALAQEKGLDVLDLHALYRDEKGFLPESVSNDGLHLKPEGYRTWAEQAWALLLKRDLVTQQQYQARHSAVHYKDWQIRNGRFYDNGKWVFLKIGKPLRNFADEVQVDELIADLETIKKKGYNCLEINCYWHHFDTDGDGVPDVSLEPLRRLMDTLYEKGIYPCLSVETYGVGGGQIPEGFWQKYPNAVAINDHGKPISDTEYGTGVRVPSIFCGEYREAAHTFIKSLARALDTRKILYFETTVEPQYMGSENLCYSTHARKEFQAWATGRQIECPPMPEGFPIPASFRDLPVWNQFRSEFLSQWINDDAAAFREIAGEKAFVAVDYLETDGPEMVNRLGNRHTFLSCLTSPNIIQVNWHWHLIRKTPNQVAYDTVRQVMKETGRDWAIMEHMTFNGTDYSAQEAPAVLENTLKNGTRFGWEFVDLGASSANGFSMYQDDWSPKPLIAVVDDAWAEWLTNIQKDEE